MNVNEIAQQKIEALEEEVRELTTLLDLRDAYTDDLMEENKALKGQLQLLRSDRRYEVA